MCAVDTKGHMQLLCVTSMLQAHGGVALSEFFAPQTFLDWVTKALRRFEKTKAKLGEGKLLYSASRALSNTKKSVLTSSMSQVEKGHIDFRKFMESMPFSKEGLEKLEAK